MTPLCFFLRPSNHRSEHDGAPGRPQRQGRDGYAEADGSEAEDRCAGRGVIKGVLLRALSPLRFCVGHQRSAASCRRPVFLRVLTNTLRRSRTQAFANAARSILRMQAMASEAAQRVDNASPSAAHDYSVSRRGAPLSGAGGAGDAADAAGGGDVVAAAAAGNGSVVSGLRKRQALERTWSAASAGVPRRKSTTSTKLSSWDSQKDGASPSVVSSAAPPADVGARGDDSPTLSGSVVAARVRRASNTTAQKLKSWPEPERDDGSRAPGAAIDDSPTLLVGASRRGGGGAVAVQGTDGVPIILPRISVRKVARAGNAEGSVSNALLRRTQSVPRRTPRTMEADGTPPAAAAGSASGDISPGRGDRLTRQVSTSPRRRTSVVASMPDTPSSVATLPGEREKAARSPGRSSGGGVAAVRAAAAAGHDLSPRQGALPGDASIVVRGAPQSRERLGDGSRLPRASVSAAAASLDRDATASGPSRKIGGWAAARSSVGQQTLLRGAAPSGDASVVPRVQSRDLLGGNGSSMRRQSSNTPSAPARASSGSASTPMAPDSSSPLANSAQHIVPAAGKPFSTRPTLARTYSTMSGGAADIDEQHQVVASALVMATLYVSRSLPGSTVRDGRRWVVPFLALLLGRFSCLLLVADVALSRSLPPHLLQLAEIQRATAEHFHGKTVRHYTYNDLVSYFRARAAAKSPASRDHRMSLQQCIRRNPPAEMKVCMHNPHAGNALARQHPGEGQLDAALPPVENDPAHGPPRLLEPVARSSLRDPCAAHSPAARRAPEAGGGQPAGVAPVRRH